jgi:hypothetical protein
LPVANLSILSEEADPKVLSVVVDCPDDALTNQPFPCTVHTTVHNNGPATPVSVDVSTTLVAPFDCTLSPVGAQNSPRSLAVSTNQVVSFTWQATCTDYSFHMFVANSTLTPTHPGLLETNPNNNTGSGQDTTAVSSPIDVKVTAVAPSGPASAGTGTPFNVDVAVSVHNNGPISPVKVEGGAGIAVTPDCTVAPAGHQLFNITSVPSSSTVVVTKTFTITCTAGGLHQFVVCGRAGPNTLHVAEVSTFNNFKSGPYPVAVDSNSPVINPIVGCSIAGDPPEVCDDGVDNDGDGDIDEEPDTDLDGQSDCVDNDDDNDGFSDTAEQHVGTDPLNNCPRGPFDSAWPPDFDNSRIVEVGDIISFKPVFGTVSGLPGWDVRHDIVPSGMIDVTDILAVKPYFFVTCS